MGDVIFCRPRHEYQSYSDLYRLIQMSGYPLIYIDEINPFSDDVYIITILNGEWQDGWPGATAQIILYDLEWHLPTGDLQQWNEEIRRPGVARVWAADKWYAEKIGAEYVPLGSHPGLGNGADVSGKMYDVALMAYLGPHRRAHVVHQLQDYRLTLAPNAWGAERDEILIQSRAMVHIHQHGGVQTVAPQRWALAAAYKLPLISETVESWGVFDHTHMIVSDYGNLAECAQTWVRRNPPEVLQSYGEKLYQLLCVEHTFRKCVEAAL
jgi:hypothetical protein